MRFDGADEADRDGDRGGGLYRAGAAWSRADRNIARLPFFKELVFNLGWAFVLLGAFVIVAAGNAVNLTDGLDGLAIVPVMIAAATFGLISYLAGNAVFSISSDTLCGRHRRAGRAVRSGDWREPGLSLV